MPEPNYDVFVSYRRSDGNAVARWVRRQIESFRVPKSLRQKFGRKLRVYLDAAYERGASDFYEENIKPALLSSRFLFVVATPDAIRRPGGTEDWIDREVRDFADGPNGSNVIAIRGAGEFAAPLPSDLQDRFPHIEIIDLRGAGPFSFLNPVRAARLSSEKLKLVGPLLGIPPEEMPKLRQEEEKRQQTRLGGFLGITLGVLVAVSSLSVFAILSRNQAIRAFEDSMFGAGAMAVQAAALGTDDPDTTRIRRLIMNRGCDLLDKFRRGAISEPQINDIVTCRFERAQEREGLGEQEEARKLFGEAIELASLRDQRMVRIDGGLSLVEARAAYAAYLVRQKDASGAEFEYNRLLADSRRLTEVHEGRVDFVRWEGEALGQLGDLAAGRNDHAKAAASYDAARDSVHRLLEGSERLLEGSEKKQPDPQMIAWLARLHRLAGWQLFQLGDVDEAIERFRRSVGVRSLMGPEQLPPVVEYEMAAAQVSIFQLESSRDNAGAADTARREAINSIDLIAKSDVSRELKQWAAQLRRSIEAADANK
jgi:tetratricopeptide (TPR) repeat protein